jgi:hypothetical protein
MLANKISQLVYATCLLYSAFKDTTIRLKLKSKIKFTTKKPYKLLEANHVANESRFVLRCKIFVYCSLVLAK